VARRTVIETIPESCVLPRLYDAVQMQLCLASISLPAIEKKNKYFKQFLGIFASALSPVISILSLAKAIGDIFDVLEAVVTLNPVEIVEALQAVIEDLVDIMRMIPMTAVPVFIYDLLRLFVQLLDVLEDEIDGIVAFEGSIESNAYNSETLQCVMEQLGAVKEMKLREFESFLLLFAPINVLLKLMGQDEISVSGTPNFDNLKDVIGTVKAILNKVIGGN
jgi:hypothetical protein